MERCELCGTEGATNSMGRFVSRDWLRASELKSENDRLRVCEQRLADVVRWLEANQPDVFRRGIWDALTPNNQSDRLAEDKGE